MLKPKDCRNLQDVREGIDTIDKQIFTLFLQRLDYVYSASRFKPDEASISAPERVESMLDERRRWAKEHHVDENFIASLYENIIHKFISAQIKFWRASKSS
ncbi:MULTISPECIES: isochorismate lyase [Brenneria]|uniref:chorismate mutase n=1 Tax=Brenneria nigrifluens DSM 30175 = ATCC 13028 TaxID=1121120 RepID=A0A2U1UP81_9GAMM|nr:MULTISPECIES: isochorismate lyase [Brenneria]EHD23304.1 chorismate mutase related enzyme [Brenneria sp. EniD312]PWC23489.1 isochorismate-pyruvate lyase [Brenneria nigrifluens DSM 30175 = ATCC 13028]QCR06236.1 isochorismate lyase [Brenneria nigrifluens] [Brenneria nigrifluens DSM 30175 = ATCC 13028]